MVGRIFIGLVVVAVVAGGHVPARAFAEETILVGKATCGPDDLVETGLQGQVPVPDRISGRAAQGYNCNLTKIGGSGSVADDPTQSKTAGFANFDVYDHCAYYGDGNDGSTVVVDVSDPAKPVETTRLTTAAMQGPWESLRANHRRGLLVADHMASDLANGNDAPGTSPLDIYDVTDCAHPKLLFSGPLPNGVGHEGWFQPDGMVYYVASIGTITPVDISDPRKPKELATWDLTGSHGGSVSADGTRGYFCGSEEGGDGITVVDTTDVVARKPGAEFKPLGSVLLPDNSACQETYPVTYAGHPYVIQFGELPGKQGCNPSDTRPNFSHPHLIDVADERNPKVVAHWINEVEDPANCEAVQGDRPMTTNRIASFAYALFLYGTHMCHPDRLEEPTIMACGEFFSGVRVYDIRDPFKPREIAYYNPGTLSPTTTTVDQSASRPVIRPDRGEIWFGSLFKSFHVLKFAPGVYPFDASLRCATRWDYLFAQYNQIIRCNPGGTPQARPPAARPCATHLRVTVRRVLGARRARAVRSVRVYANGRRVQAVRGRRARRAVVLRRLSGPRVTVRMVARTKRGGRVARSRTFELCG